MKKVIITLLVLFSIPALVLAEDKPLTNEGGYVTIPKIEETADSPILVDGDVYPFWGPVCQRYTYSVYYKDKEGREPEYVKMYFNGDWLEMEKADPENSNYKSGVKYIYKFVPTKIGSNFYFFEASNGLGKTRDSIIDSPDNGPVLFDSAFDQNEVVLIDRSTNQIRWRYSTGKEWISGVALSDDGKYLAVQSWGYVYLFETTKAEPLWIYDAENTAPIGGDVKGGIDISADGSKIFAGIGSKAFLFNKDSNQPVWDYETGKNVSGNAHNVAISDDGKYASVAMAGGGECIPGVTGHCKGHDVLILWDTQNREPLWKYQTLGNFHDVSLSSDGSFLATSTGCPDRRAYIFSKDSNEPLVRSEMLTRDCPVHKAQISADGSLATFGAESGDGAVFLFSKDSADYLWKFPTPQGSSARALAITSDGSYIGAATLFGGHAYIFSKDSADPIDSWQVKEAALGALDISDDGSYIAAGGNDNKVHIFEKGSDSQAAEVTLNEYVGELDIAANGELIAAGTSGSVYFFESLTSTGIEVIGAESEVETACTEIIEPEPEEETIQLDYTEPEQILEWQDEPQDEPKEDSWQDILKDFIYHQGKFIILAFLVFLIATIVLFIRFKKKWIWVIFIILVAGLVILSLCLIRPLQEQDSVEIDQPDKPPADNSKINVNQSIVNQNGNVIENVIEGAE